MNEIFIAQFTKITHAYCKMILIFFSFLKEDKTIHIYKIEIPQYKKSVDKNLNNLFFVSWTILEKRKKSGVVALSNFQAVPNLTATR